MEPKQQPNGYKIVTSAADELTLFFSGRLDSDIVAEIWQECLSIIAKQRPKSLVLNLKAIEYCDGSGIAFLQALKSQQLISGRNFSIINLKTDLQHLLSYIEAQSAKTETIVARTENFPAQLGEIAVNYFKDFRDNIIFLGMLFYYLVAILFRSKKLRWRDFFRVFEDTGPNAFLIVALIGFLIGLISTFQAAPSFEQFGAQIYIVNLVGLGLVREMGPLLTAVLLAGRTASAFAAELGTMKINEEISALKTMGLNPVQFLVVPRILATIIITPLLEVFMIVFGLFGCLLVMSTLGYTWDAFSTQLHQSIVPKDCIGGLVKIFVFGWVIAGVGCLHGLKTRFGAQAVGRSTTQAVVSSLIMLVVVDGLFAVIYYVLGI